MAGLYIHIPFCKQSCHYCDFHFSTSLQNRAEMIAALATEISLQAAYLSDNKLQTIYLGGGTPSLLTEAELLQLWAAIDAHFDVVPGAEVTLEANPDDLSLYQLNMLFETRINRLSIGIQSFRDEDLVWMNRAHKAQEAADCLRLAREVGFELLTADLIYGLPALTDADWVANLDKLFAYDLPHFSAYALTVEPKTALHHFIKTGKSPAPTDADQQRQFDLLMDMAAARGYEHYEISNFAKPGSRAVHNSSYWQGAPYLGIGPSAHSFNGYSRQWNVSNNQRYIKAIATKEIPCTKEQLSLYDRFNERILTSLRMSDGLNLLILERDFGSDLMQAFKAALHEIDADLWRLSDNHLVLTKAGKHLADRIASDLFILADDDDV
jgi:oxygen-independent coproporphyrinogen-3 oxidase